jgi:hypothetical protein
MEFSNNIVILGAGASAATMQALGLPGPSTMDRFIEDAKLDYVLDKIKLTTTSRNLETIYSEIEEKPEYAHIKNELEKKIYHYISRFSLPHDQVSLYDLLFLSLRHNDCLATFNWDRLLVQAYYRVATKMDAWGISNPFSLLPIPIFLHGNVGVGICCEHRKYGENNDNCPVCKKKLEKMPLLYPSKTKNYTDNIYISDAWKRLKVNLNYSRFLTIFGYGAPASDFAVMDIFKREYGDVKKKFINRFEVVDVKGRDVIYNTWNPFIDHNGCDYFDCILNTMIMQYPHQDIDIFYRRNVSGEWCGEPITYPDKITWDYVEKMFKPMFLSEQCKGNK